MDIRKTFYAPDRSAWRTWLQKYWQSEPDIWLINPHKDTGRPRVPYNDAVEEALCVGWIDSTIQKLDEHTAVQRYTPRRKNSPYSRPNIERLIWLLEHDLVHQELINEMKKVAETPFTFPEDILKALKTDPEVWRRYCDFSPSYQRIRIAYIENAREIPELFEKRLQNFVKKTQQGKQFGYGGIDKYF